MIFYSKEIVLVDQELKQFKFIFYFLTSSFSLAKSTQTIPSYMFSYIDAVLSDNILPNNSKRLCLMKSILLLCTARVCFWLWVCIHMLWLLRTQIRVSVWIAFFCSDIVLFLSLTFTKHNHFIKSTFFRFS